MVKMVKELSGKEFDKFISEGVSVVDFWAEWCGPCKISSPNFEKAAEQNKKIKFGKVNVDENYEIASKFSVMSIPTFIFFKDGEMVDRHTGVMDVDDIEDKIKENF